MVDADAASAAQSPFAGLRVAFSTLGCKVNASESESLISTFLERGYQVVPFEEQADVYVINTCTVTTMADRKSRREVRQAGRMNPLALVVATGCYVSVAHRDLSPLLPGNLLVVPNREKINLADRVELELATRRSCTGAALRPAPTPPASGRAGLPASIMPMPVAVGADQQRTRATLKVQDGCNAGCAFCIIPRARGGPRSVSLGEAVRAAVALEEHGYREIVLTGVLLGSYGRDLPDKPDLANLIAAILRATRRLRLRISSIEPQDFKPDWLALWQDARLCPHLHMPLQSGSDAVLSIMRRQYDTAAYARLATKARAAIPSLALTTDVMVGFPGEDEARFQESLAFARAMSFAQLHVFRYSARPGTPAARMAEQVAETIKAARSEYFRLLACQLQRDFHARFSGTHHEVLWEAAENGTWHGLTSNYLHAYQSSSATLHNTVQRCRLGRPHEQGLWAAPA
jgi:threonylcarbamoyladenosine tRNA methylthiotransferase MtaB